MGFKNLNVLFVEGCVLRIYGYFKFNLLKFSVYVNFEMYTRIVFLGVSSSFKLCKVLKVPDRILGFFLSGSKLG